eukprot:3863229-Prymnesium_polylepis.1
MNAPSRCTDLRLWCDHRDAHRAKAQRLDTHARPQSRTVRDATLKTPWLWRASSVRRKNGLCLIDRSALAGPFYIVLDHDT